CCATREGDLYLCSTLQQAPRTRHPGNLTMSRTLTYASHLLLLVGLVTVVGCVDDARGGGDGSSTCGEGESVTIDGDALCVYTRDLVIENDFSCPSELGTLAPLGPIAVCSSGELEQ